MTPITAHTEPAFRAAMTHGWEQGKRLLAEGKPVAVLVAEHEDDISVRQRGFLHKAVFPQIEQGYMHPDGTRTEWRAWKEYFRARFLGDRRAMRRVPRHDAKTGRMVLPKRKTPHRERVSTEDLTVKQYSAYIDTVIDHAVTELGVTFEFIASEREGVRYVAPARKKHPQPEPAEA